MLGKKKRAYTLYCLVGTILEEAALAIIVLWVLPRFEINIPLWLLIVLMLVTAIYSYITFRLGKQALILRPAVGAEAMIGTRCKAVGALSPNGYVRIGREMWRARSIDSNLIEEGAEVVIMNIDKLTLIVASPSDTNTQLNNSKQAALKNNESGGRK